MGWHRMLRRWNNGVEGTLQNSSVTSEYGEPSGVALLLTARCHESARCDCLLKTQDFAKLEKATYEV